ncbi:hypothetical protein K488DRAFT_59456, partial [Vararia minispora EC-137]
QFREAEGDILDRILRGEADDRIGSRCACGEGTCTVRCNDCVMRPPSCEDCFIRQHKWNPTHWAHVWDEDSGVFRRSDISFVSARGDDGKREAYTFQLGHGGERCPYPSKPIQFTLVDINGVHGTPVRFCGCYKHLEKYQQLLDARLFPATLRAPQTAFTFRLLKTFHLIHLEGKASALDLMGALRRLTDNVFTDDVPVRTLRLILCPLRLLTFFFFNQVGNVSGAKPR